MTSNRHSGIFYGVDLWTVLLYVLIVLAGWVSITSASYDEGAADLFSFSHFYMKQLLWIGVAWVTALVVLLLDERFYHMFAYPAYLGGIALLLAALLFGREVNGAKAWFEFGSFRVQPVEFAKIATALALARVMSEYSFSINRAGDLFRVGMVICIPLFIIILQNDTGSGIVLGSFLFVLYREGLNKWLCIPVLLIAALFIVSFLLSPMTLLVSLILVCTLSEAMMNGLWRSRIVFLAVLALASILLCLVMSLIAPGVLDIYHCAADRDDPLAGIRGGLRLPVEPDVTSTLRWGCSSVRWSFCPRPTTSSNSILKQHQRDRILSFLGIISDPLGTDYNVNQSKIAIGSGGFWGKGFLRGYPDQIQTSCPSGTPTSSSAPWAKSGVFWARSCVLVAAVHPDPAPDAHGRAAAGAFRPDLLLLRGGDPAVPRAGQRGHDHRTDARHGHSAALHELRGFVAASPSPSCCSSPSGSMLRRGSFP